MKKTFLYNIHQRSGAKMVPFGGWKMPVHYGSQIKEHETVRRSAGMFDVSHMMVVDLQGAQVQPFLRKLLANSIDKLEGYGHGLYSCMLNPSGGVIDDLITYVMSADWSRMVVNAATGEKDLAWIQRVAEPFELTVHVRTDVCMLAVQGPAAREKLLSIIDQPCRDKLAALQLFHAVSDHKWFIARTGYTGEDGFEVILPEDEAEAFWLALSNAGVKACGLGARDTLRLEAGLNLYGTDMDEAISPLACGLGWTVAWQPEDRDFIGRQALVDIKASGHPRFVGLILQDKGVLRSHQTVIIDDREVGVVTSGSFSPTMRRSIGLARIDDATATHCEIVVRDKRLRANIVKPPFVRNGEVRY